MNKKIAIVYDWIDSWGGVERVLIHLSQMFPDAAFFTSYTNFEKASWAKKLKIRSSFIQVLPSFIRKSRPMSVPFYPFAFESFDFSEYDLVISVTSSFAKSIITRPETLHICYHLTPTRFLWTHPQTPFLTGPIVNHLKKWDSVAAQRPDKFISISKTIQQRTKDIYNRNSEVIFPPFDVDYWKKIKPSNIPDSWLLTPGYYLIVSRLEPYKKVDLVVQMFKQLDNENLIIVGNGTEEKKLKSLAGRNITFLKNVSDNELASLYSSAKALIMPQEEDFGYVSLESQLFGCPIIALKKGGATETVVENKTGIFFDNQSVEAILNALANFEKMSYTLRESTLRVGPGNVEKFSKQKFTDQFQKIISSNLISKI